MLFAVADALLAEAGEIGARAVLYGPGATGQAWASVPVDGREVAFRVPGEPGEPDPKVYPEAIRVWRRGELMAQYRVDVPLMLPGDTLTLQLP